ncbi:MAG: endonuclease/exonuclease/phosphatase family protein [Pseudomonadota bacterium]
MVFVAFAICGLFLASYAGALHPALDSLAVLRIPLALAVLLLAVARLARQWWILPPCILAAAFLAYESGGWRLLRPSDAAFSLYQRNLLYRNQETEAVLDEIWTLAPDVITFQELSSQNQVLLEQLRELYPNQLRCPYGPRYSIAILTRLPLGPDPAQCSGSRGAAALQLSVDGTLGWVVAVHLLWPWPFGDPAQPREFAGFIAALPGPKAVAGDFNQVPWSDAVRRIMGAADARYLGPRRHTFVTNHIPLPLPIDHVLAPSGYVTLLPKTGSDHYGLFAEIAFHAN